MSVLLVPNIMIIRLGCSSAAARAIVTGCAYSANQMQLLVGTLCTPIPTTAAMLFISISPNPSAAPCWSPRGKEFLQGTLPRRPTVSRRTASERTSSSHSYSSDSSCPEELFWAISSLPTEIPTKRPIGMSTTSASRMQSNTGLRR